MSIEQDLHKFIVDSLLDGDADSMPAADEPLVGAVVDSVGLHELIAFIEKKYGFEIGESDVVPERFENLNAIVAFVAAKTQGQ